MYSKLILTAIVITISVLFFVACDDNTNKSGTPPSGGVPIVAKDTIISGAAYGFRNGIVSLYTLDIAGNPAKLITDGVVTGNDGTYKIVTKGLSSGFYALVLEFAEGSIPLYYETALHPSLLGKTPYKTYAKITAETTNEINLSYYTTLAVALALYYIQNGMDLVGAINQGNTSMSTLIGIDVVKTFPIDLTFPNTETVKDGHLYGALLGANSYVMKNVSLQNGETIVGEKYNTPLFINTAYDDIYFDGTLNGVGTNGNKYLGLVKVDADTYRNKVALATIEFTKRVGDRSLLKIGDVIPFITTLNNTSGVIFGSKPSIPFDATKPIISSINISDNATVGGIVKLDVAINDLSELIQVSLKIDNTDLVMTSVLNLYSASIASTTYDDGSHALTVYAKNILGGETTKTIPVTILNKDIGILSTSPLPGSYLKGIVPFKYVAGDITNGIKNIKLSIDDISYGTYAGDTAIVDIITNNKNVPFIDGSHMIKVEPTNNVGITKAFLYTYTVDNTPPVAELTNIIDNERLSSTASIFINVTDGIALDHADVLLGGVVIGTTTQSGVNNITYVTELVDSKKPLTLLAYDKAGNSTKVEKMVYIDNNPPELFFYFIGNDPLNSDYNLAVNSTDGNGINRVEFYIDGEFIGNGYTTTNPIHKTINTSNWCNGTHKIVAIAVDNAGNRTNKSVSVVFSNPSKAACP